MKHALLLLALPALQVIRAQQPAFHWPLDESSGTVAHAWGGSDGILAGGTTWDPLGGHHQGAARFDGVDDRIILGPCDITSGDGTMTISLWTKPDFVTGMERTLIAKAIGPQAADHVWSITFVNGSALRFRLKTGGNTAELTTSPSSLFGGNWYHIVGVFDGAEMRLYVNAGLLGSMPRTGIVGMHPQAPASIGALSTGSQPYSGWIDDVRIYDRALDLNEITDLLFATMTTHLAEEDRGNINDLQSLRDSNCRLSIRDMLGRTLWSGIGGDDALSIARSFATAPILVEADLNGARRVFKLLPGP